MRNAPYAIGDNVTLITGIIRPDAGAKECRIVGLLPVKENGERQYRVQLGDEKFERRIAESDIEASSGPDGDAVPADTDAPLTGSSWLTTSSIRSRRTTPTPRRDG